MHTHTLTSTKFDELELQSQATFPISPSWTESAVIYSKMQILLLVGVYTLFYFLYVTFLFIFVLFIVLTIKRNVLLFISAPILTGYSTHTSCMSSATPSAPHLEIWGFPSFFRIMRQT